jgi:hypothetical protein
MVKTSISRPDLILRPDMFPNNILFNMDGFIGQFSLSAMAASERVESVEQADREGRRRAKARTRREVAIVVNLEPIAHRHFAQYRPYDRMPDLGNFLHVLDERVNDTMLVLEKGRQTAHADIAIPIDREAKD